MVVSMREVRTPHSSAIPLALIVLLAFGLRIAWISWADSRPPFLSDPEYYHSAAVSLSRGSGYSVTFGEDGWTPGGSPTAFWPPGYSLALASFYRVLGAEPWVGPMVNALSGALTAVAVFF